MALWVVGAVINVIGSILINLGTNLIKLGHTRTAILAEGPAPKLFGTPRLWWRYPGNKIWLGGMSMFSVGNLLNFASFAFAAQSLLSALGVVQFLSNIVFGKFVNKEKVTKRVLLATANVSCGCVLLVVFGNHESPTLSTHDLLQLYHAPLYIAYLCVIFCLSPAMYMLYRAGKRAILADVTGTLAARKWARWLPISYALFAGLLGTQSVLYGKTVSMLLRTTLSGDSQLANWYFWLSLCLVITFAGFWMSRYSKAMKLFPVLIIMPLIQIVWVLFSMISGSLYYQEYKTLNALSGSMFALGVVVLLAGVWLLTGGKPPAPPPRELKVELSELSEEARARLEKLDQLALRSKAPLSDSLDAMLAASSSPSAQLLGALEPEEALVARKLSRVYLRQPLSAANGCGGGGGGNGPPSARIASVPAAPGASGRPGSASANEDSRMQLVEEGTCDSSGAMDVSPWPATATASTAAGGGEADGEAEVSSRPPQIVVVPASAGNEPADAGASAAPAGVSPRLRQPSLLQDLRSDWGVGVRDVAAVMRASVGMRQDDEETAAFSIWSMPMPCSASFTAAGAGGRRSLESTRARPTFRVRSALEALHSGGGGADSGGSPAPGAADGSMPVVGGSAGRPGPGHRRLNRSHSANELDDMLRQGQLLDHAELAERALSGGAGTGDASLGSALHGSTAAAAAATSGFANGGTPGVLLRPESSAGSAPAHSPLPSRLGRAPAASMTPPAAQPKLGPNPSSAGSAPRRPWSAQEAQGTPLSPAFSQGSRQDESGALGSGQAPAREGLLPASEFLSGFSPASERDLAGWMAPQQKGRKAA